MVEEIIILLFFSMIIEQLQESRTIIITDSIVIMYSRTFIETIVMHNLTRAITGAIVDNTRE